MIKSNTELANHICNEVHGLDFENVLERLEKTRPHEPGTVIFPEEVDQITGEIRDYFTGEFDF